jgi:hypothetical protein
MATFLPPAAMVGHLARILGPGASVEAAVDLYDALVLRGYLKPWGNGLWELERLSAQQLQEIARASGGEGSTGLRSHDRDPG